MNYVWFPVRVSQQCKHLKSKTTDLFITDTNDINS